MNNSLLSCKSAVKCGGNIYNFDEKHYVYVFFKVFTITTSGRHFAKHCSRQGLGYQYIRPPFANLSSLINFFTLDLTQYIAYSITL
jgi:hypothetical protein